MRRELKLPVDWGFSRMFLQFLMRSVPDSGRCVGPRMANMMMRAYRVGAGETEEVRKFIWAWWG